MRPDGKHEVATVLQRVELHDDIDVVRAPGVVVEGFAGDTLVRGALRALAQEAGVEPGWRVRVEKRIPVSAGLGGGSSDAACALLLANATLDRPLSRPELHRIAAGIGSDVPFFLQRGARLATGSGVELTPVVVPADYAVLLVLPHGVTKGSTADVYRDFDVRGGGAEFEDRWITLSDALARAREASDLARLPHNDLVSSPLAETLTALGAFRADVSGAGPVVYGLFRTSAEAASAAGALGDAGRTWVTHPVAGP